MNFTETGFADMKFADIRIKLQLLSFVVFSVLLTGDFASNASAQLTSQHRKDLSSLRRDISSASSDIRRKKFEEAEKALDEAEEKLKTIAEESGLDAKSKAIAGMQRAIDLQRRVLAKAQGGGKPAAKEDVSFSKDVAKILNDKCVRCHSGNNPRGRLSLDTFAGMKKGGMNGPLLTPGNPQRSLIMARLLAPQQQRMPRGGAALARKELEAIAGWISDGAKFDGDSEDSKMADLVKNAGKPPIKINKPDGTETVSFSKDIAPFFARLCVGCHSGNNPRGGLSLVTFEDLMRGGDSGEVLIAGELENSRLFRLVGGLENPRMPQGQARITRKNYEDLKAWVKEGIKFDGDSIRTPLRDMIPSAEDLAAEKFAKMTEEDYKKHRKDQTERNWKRVLSREEPVMLETDDFLLIGNVSEARLKEVSEWATSYLPNLKKAFDVKQKQIWKGRLAIFIYKDRFGYAEFNQTINNRQALPGMEGHAVVTNYQDEAYIALEDIGDSASQKSPGLKFRLYENLVAAYLKKETGNLPNWLIQGTGMALASKEIPAKDYLDSTKAISASAVKAVLAPADILRQGTFSPAQTGPVGYTLVEFLLQSGGTQRLGQFVRALTRNNDLNAAFKSAYNSDTNEVARAFQRALASR